VRHGGCHRLRAHFRRYLEGDRRGHYESYFQRANHRERPLAFWICYIVFCPKGRREDAVGELRAIYFDSERKRVTAAKEVLRFLLANSHGRVAVER